MVLTWTTVKGSIRPIELDKVSSSTYVYIRRNIREIPIDNPMGEEIPEGCPTTQFEYEEAKISNVEYNLNYGSLDDETVRQELSDQELQYSEELAEKYSQMESLAQEVSELELKIAEVGIIQEDI